MYRNRLLPVLFFTFGLCLGCLLSVIWCRYHQVRRTYFSPESLGKSPVDISLKGNLEDVLSHFLSSTKIENPNAHFETQLLFASKHESLSNERVSISQPTTNAWAINTIASISGASIVWSANEIIIGPSDLNESNVESLKLSRTLLYTALCNQNRKEFPANEEEITVQQEVDLVESLRQWGIKNYDNRGERIGECVIKGSIYNLNAVKVELASYFNKVAWNSKYQ